MFKHSYLLTVKQTNIKHIARQRIEILFDQAKKVSKTDNQLAAQYVKSARRIAMAAKIRLPLEFRRQTCKAATRCLRKGLTAVLG